MPCRQGFRCWTFLRQDLSDSTCMCLWVPLLNRCYCGQLGRENDKWETITDTRLFQETPVEDIAPRFVEERRGGGGQKGKRGEERIAWMRLFFIRPGPLDPPDRGLV